MLAKVLFITDLHKRYADSTSIKGLVEVQYKQQEELIQFIKANGINMIWIAGDWYDRGFHGLCQTFGSVEMDRRISDAVNGQVYLCIGNHFFLERDENPEMYIIQPNALVKPQRDIPLPEKPIFNVVNQLRIGDVQVDFFHYNKLNKYYYAYRADDVKFHIGIYHDDVTLPGAVREKDGYTGATTQSYMNKIYSNIDLALHGHIHTKIGVYNQALQDGREVPLVVPGALGISQNKAQFRHTTVELPILTIDDDSTVSMGFASFATHMDELRFYEPKKRKKNIGGEMLAAVNITDAQIQSGTVQYQNLSSYLVQRGYSPKQLRIIDAAMGGTLSIGSAIMLLTEQMDGYNESPGATPE